MVVLAGYKTVKEALVNYADEFGDRDQLLLAIEENRGHGKESADNFPVLFNFRQMSSLFILKTF